jgi:hypothetical protein
MTAIPDRLFETAKSCSIPLLFAELYPNGNIRDPNIRGATAFLWESPSGRFLVTAAHVWTALVKLKVNGTQSGHIVLPDHPGLMVLDDVLVVDSDDQLDLAVLSAPMLKNRAPHGKDFFCTPHWPQLPLQSGSTVAFHGYPRDLRQSSDKMLFLDPLYMEGNCDVSASGQVMMFAHDKTESLWKLGPNPAAGHPFAHATAAEIVGNFPKDLRGISGGPLFALVDDQPSWVGVIKEGTGDCDQFCVRITPSGAILADGHIQSTP